MAKVEEITVARVMIIWDGNRVEVRSNAAPHVTVLMCGMAYKLQMDKLLAGGPAAGELAAILRGER